MFGTNGRVAEALRLIGFCFLIYVLLEIYQVARQSVSDIKAAELETLDKSIDPVRLLMLDARECLGDHFIVSGYLDKTRYPDGSEATFKGMRIYDIGQPPNRLPWRPTSESEAPNDSRRYGEQSIDFIIEADCDVVFTVDTEHESPLTGRRIKMTWGGFIPPFD